MTLHLKIENPSEHIDIYEEIELMFTAWENYKKNIEQEMLMPEVELVHRILGTPTPTSIATSAKA